MLELVASVYPRGKYPPPPVENKAFQIWEFIWVFFRRGEEWYLCIMRHSLKFTLCKTREQTGFFVSFFQLSARQDKDKWQNRWEIYNLGYIFAHKGEGVKNLDRFKSENNSYFIIWRTIVPNLFCMQIRYTLPPPLPNVKIYSPNLLLK